MVCRAPVVTAYGFRRMPDADVGAVVQTVLDARMNGRPNGPAAPLT